MHIFGPFGDEVGDEVSQNFGVVFYKSSVNKKKIHVYLIVAWFIFFNNLYKIGNEEKNHFVSFIGVQCFD